MRIVADSSCDLSAELREKMDITLVPLTIQIGDRVFVDNDDLDVDEMLAIAKSTKAVPKTSCPSPEDFIEAYKRAGSVFVVTMTSALSGTYNSAMLAKDIFMQEYGEKCIHIFDSKGSASKETLMALKIQELIDRKLNDAELIKEAEAYFDSMTYIFQLGNLDALIKNGRISRFKGIMANALNIRPILYADEKGEICLLENVRSEKKSINRLVELMGDYCSDFSDRVLGIAHCNAFEKAQAIAEEARKRYPFKDVVIVKTRGLSSIYTNEGGVTISF